MVCCLRRCDSWRLLALLRQQPTLCECRRRLGSEQEEFLQWGLQHLGFRWHQPVSYWFILIIEVLAVFNVPWGNLKLWCMVWIASCNPETKQYTNTCFKHNMMNDWWVRNNWEDICFLLLSRLFELCICRVLVTVVSLSLSSNSSSKTTSCALFLFPRETAFQGCIHKWNWFQWQ